jgi:RNA polymerase sigma factor (TIGR02999 family)
MAADDVSTLLARARAGDRLSQERLFEVVYAELRRIAASFMRRERSNHTLQPSALVNEACVRMLGRAEAGWENRAHFFKTAAGVMRNILIDYARTRNARKRDGLLERVELDWEPLACAAADPERLVAVDVALEKLAAWDERQARVVELRFFAGFDVDETADILGVSPKTVKRDWSMARAWLLNEIGGQSGR